MGLRGAKLALERPAEAWCLAAGVLRKSCLGWACGGRACWNKLGHGEGHGRDKPGSTPPVVPGAAPALAKAGVGGFDGQSDVKSRSTVQICGGHPTTCVKV